MPQLKELLRERGLPVSGTKSVLIERLLAAMKADVDAAPQPLDPLMAQSKAECALVSGISAERRGQAVPGYALGDESSSWREASRANGAIGTEDDSSVQKSRWYVQNALISMISASFVNEDGNKREIMSSRNVGRALSDLPAPDGSNQSALMCLKNRWSSLRAFLKSCPSKFELVDSMPSNGDSIVFGVIMVNGEQDTREATGELDAEQRHRGSRSAAASAALRGPRNSG